MKYSKHILFSLFFSAFCLLAIYQSQAQRNINYRQLAMKGHQQSLFFDFFVLPGETESTVTFTSVFSLSYKFLPFRKSNNFSADPEFTSAANLNMEVFKANKSALGKKDASIEGLESVGRAFWTDTAYASSYEQSQSENNFLSGQLSTSLKPGIYSYVLQMNRGDESNNKVSRVRSIKIEPYDKMKSGNVILADQLITEGTPPKLKLIGMGDQVPYGKDFYALAYIPSYDSNSEYSFKVNKLDISDDDTSNVSQIYSINLADDDIKTKVKPQLASPSKEGVFLNLHSSPNGYTYALVKIPNSTFENSPYRLTIEKKGEKKPSVKSVFRSIWIDMPTSLLNLDVATDMLRYIIDEDQLKKLSSGSQKEREKKFRAFWKERDPTPKTEYNELLAEYYRRVDYAYNNFTTENSVGYESDQGEIYIKLGPPKNIERKFPPNGGTVEIWTYPSRQFIFKATTGFGDFKLLSDEQ